jgi:hypothetical protein
MFPGAGRTAAPSHDDEAPAALRESSVVDVTLRLPVGAIRALLTDELATLAAERAAHAAEVANYDAMKARVAVTHFPTCVKLDVGGAIFKTSAATLTVERGSALAAMFGGSGFDMQVNDEGAYFIDRDGTHFRHVLNYLRGCFDPETLGDAARRELLVEADFYNLRGLCRALSCMELPFSGVAADEKGVMQWLGTGQRKSAWTNPSDAGVVRVHTTMNLAAPQNMVARAGAYSGNGTSGACSVPADQSVTIELLNGVRLERPTHYSLRYGNACNQPSNWRLEAAEDASSTDFVLLREHTNDRSIQQGGNIAAWAVSVPVAAAGRAFGAFRFTCQGGCFHVGCFEVYGTVRW